LDLIRPIVIDRQFNEVAEHVSGCDMAFRGEALGAIAGFDPIVLPYRPPPSVTPCLPLTPEWDLLSLSLLACASLFGGLFWLAIVLFCITVARCFTSALRAEKPGHSKDGARLS
jgi:hypothetical protein